MDKTIKEVIRPLANFSCTVWKDADNFTSNIANRILEFNKTYDGQIEKLKDKLKEMLIAPTNDSVDKVSLINSICRLGVSYYFEVQIEEQLNRILESQPNLVDDNDYDLYTVALLFRVFKQHGYTMPCRSFNKFKDNDGKFKEILTSDAKGMLSLYEATHLRQHGEDILEKALVFSKAHLKSLAEKSSTHLAKQIINALERPSHRGMSRLEALKYIGYYEDDESRNENLLLFAKLDFNRVQLLYQQELSYLLSWWRDLDFSSKLPYIRDRIVESFFWTVTIYFEPCYSRARSILCKIVQMMTVIDDTYDAYGTIEELRLFTSAIQRWDISAIDDLPDYMKIIYSTLLNIFDETENDLNEEERSYKVSYTKEALKGMFTAYFVEAEWMNQNHVPPFNEYLRNAFISAGSFALTASTFLGMGEIAGRNAYEWLQGEPKLLKAAYLLARLQDDLGGHEFEQERAHVASSVECYMKEYGSSVKETTEMFSTMIENCWKDINEEFMKPTAVPTEILLRVANMARLAEVIYKGGVDAFTHPQHLKATITKLLFDQIPM